LCCPLVAAGRVCKEVAIACGERTYPGLKEVGLRRIFTALAIGTGFQAVIFLAIRVATVIEVPQAPGIAQFVYYLMVIAFQLLMPGFLLFVSEYNGSSLLGRLLAILFDIGVYSSFVYLYIWFKSEGKAAAERPAAALSRVRANRSDQPRSGSWK
jgi:hypothetical protein